MSDWSRRFLESTRGQVLTHLRRGPGTVEQLARGIGLTDKPADGYDTGTLAGDLVALMDALGHERFAVVGHDTGFAIGYALAADHPDRPRQLPRWNLLDPAIARSSFRGASLTALQAER